MTHDYDHKRLELALEAAGLDLWENDLLTGRVLYPARRTIRELGYELADVGESVEFFISIIHPDDVSQVIAALESYRAGGTENYRSEFRLKSKAGNWIWYANYGKVMNTPDTPELIRLIGVTFNIHERKEHEEELRRVNHLLHLQNMKLDQMNEYLQRLSTTDPLTKLLNRRALFDQLEAWESKPGRTAALLFLDLDNFKKINDLHGHDVGDFLLCEVATRLMHCIRPGDMLARFGGDEFVLLIQGDDVPERVLKTRIDGLCQRIFTTLSAPYQHGDLEFKSFCSIGVTLYPFNGAQISELTKQADLALYQAKKQGRNLWRFYEPEMEQVLKSQAKLEKELLIGLDEQQFELFYQIQVDSWRQPIGAEALLRWHHPELGLLFPVDFMPAAEATRTTEEIGFWVLETACRTLGKWRQMPLLGELTLSVNISAKVLQYPRFVETLQRLLHQYQALPERLCLELTENLQREDIPLAARVIEQIRQYGVRFALDDFGIGLASFEYLKMLPVDLLKIDKRFVEDLVDDRVSRAIVMAMISLANSLAIPVIAECVELDTQCDVLQRCGCQLFQGFYFGAPEPLGQFEASLDELMSAYSVNTVPLK